MLSYENYLRDMFLRITSISSQSNPKVKTLPSTEGQRAVIRSIEAEFRALGVGEVSVNGNCVLIAKIPATASAPPIGFMAHVDTVDIGASPEVHARLTSYDGKDLTLNALKNIVFTAEDHPEARPYIGQDVFFTDGTSVLGADDKAGVAVLLALAKFLMDEKPKHGDIFLVAVPDEEIGLKGAYSLRLADLPVDFCYTIDGGELGKFGYETFNAAGVELVFAGVSIHPGSAKGVMVNPIAMAQHFMSQFNPMDTPEFTDERQGYFWMHDLTSNPTRAILEMSLRDFDIQAFAKRKAFVEQAAEQTRKAFPRGKVSCSIADDYANIASALGEDRRCIRLAEEAFRAAGVDMCTEVIRGGTDGSVLSAKGIPTPNIFTGGLNGHSVFEFLPLPSLAKSFEVCAQIIKNAPKYIR